MCNAATLKNYRARMRYPTEGLLNFLPGKRDLCHCATAFEYSSAANFNSSYDAPDDLRFKKSSFLLRAIRDNSSVFIDTIITYIRCYTMSKLCHS
jgi:hypothetical protein